MAARTVAIGLAGLGRIGRMHAENIARRCPSATLAGVYDVVEDAARAVGERHGVPWTTSYGELLERCEAVAVATPTGTHAELVTAAARAGRPVFCEKPIAGDRAATLGVLDAVAQAGVALQVGFHRRFDPDWVAVAERRAELGDVTFFRASLRDMTPPHPEFLTASGGFFADVAVHELDVARWLVGEIAEVSAFGSAHDPAFAEIGDIDTAVVVLRFASGALGAVDLSRGSRYGYESSTELMGTRATARVETPRAVEWRTPGQASYALPADFVERYPAAYVEELDAFARCVREATPSRCTGLDALAAFDLAVAADRSWRTGRPVAVKPVPVSSDPADGVVYEIEET
ncbi:MAG: Gfo/Idh/MocA family oxidoreductase [Thermoleophilia bacterium]